MPADLVTAQRLEELGQLLSPNDYREQAVLAWIFLCYETRTKGVLMAAARWSELKLLDSGAMLLGGGRSEDSLYVSPASAERLLRLKTLRPLKSDFVFASNDGKTPMLGDNMMRAVKKTHPNFSLVGVYWGSIFDIIYNSDLTVSEACSLLPKTTLVQFFIRYGTPNSDRLEVSEKLAMSLKRHPGPAFKSDFPKPTPEPDTATDQPEEA